MWLDHTDCNNACCVHPALKVYPHTHTVFCVPGDFKSSCATSGKFAFVSCPSGSYLSWINFKTSSVEYKYCHTWEICYRQLSRWLFPSWIDFQDERCLGIRIATHGKLAFVSCPGGSPLPALTSGWEKSEYCHMWEICYRQLSRWFIFRVLRRCKLGGIRV